jgi:hypothetical protein
MQAFAACSDPEILEVVRNGVGDLVAYERVVSMIRGWDAKTVAESVPGRSVHRSSADRRSNRRTD